MRLVNNIDISLIFNMFTVDGYSKLPKLKSSTVKIASVMPPPPFFLRGDLDRSGIINITDAIMILGYLFTGGTQPPCLDAADVNDVGNVDITSAISLLNFLFLGGPAPRVPHPNFGIDPTDDNLSCGM